MEPGDPRVGETRAVGRSKAALLLSVVVLTLSGAGCGRDATPAAPLVPVPKPGLEALDEDAQALVEARQRSFEEATRAGPRADAYGELGRQYFAFEFRDAALACFENAVRLAPAEFRWRYYLGTLLQERGELDRAADELRRASELAPDDLPARLHLARVELDRGRAAAARRIFEHVLARAPSAAAHYGLGLIALGEDEPAEAVASLSEALRLDPEASAVHHSLGLAFRKAGDLDKAGHHLERGGPRRPSFEDPLLDSLGDLVTGPRVHLQQGGKARNEGDLELAMAHYRKAWELDPDNAVASHNLGATLGLLDRHAEALRHLDRAVEIDPRHRDAHFDRATALTRLGRLQEAAGALEKVLEIDPRDRDARYRLALVSEALGERRRAATELAALVAAAPDDVQARLRLAKLLQETGHGAEAETHYAWVLEVDPRHPEAYQGRGRALVDQERYAEARRFLESGLELGSPELARMLARLLATCPRAAVRDGERALELAQALFGRARTLENALAVAMAMAELGRFDEAVEWQRSLLRQAEEAELPAARIAILRTHLELYERGEPVRVVTLEP